MRWRVKKLITEGAWGNVGIVVISSWKCNFNIYLDIQVCYLDIHAITTLLCLLLFFYVLIPSIHSFFYHTTALLKSDVFRQSKVYSSHSFQPTGIRLGSLWRAYRCVLPIISVYLLIGKFYFLLFLKFIKKYANLKKIKIYYSFFFHKEIIWHTYIFTKCIDNFIFTISLKS